ncbi:Wee1-like protein kinase 1-B [Taenia solium]|eukprot:TsM_000780400 transcript=TsM_000780400 gene=TsM_000780400
MEFGTVLTPSPADASTSRRSLTFGDDPFFDDSPVRVDFSSPRPGSSYWKRRRRNFVDPSTSKEIERIRALGERLSHANSAFKTYLGFRLSFAEDMTRGSLILLQRRQISRNVSVSSSVLFGATECDELAMKRKQRTDLVDDLDQRCYARLSERVASEVEKHVMCEEATMALAQMKSCNRYASVHCDGKARHADLLDHAWLSNESSLVRVYSTLHELCRTGGGVVYKARHRLTGAVYCIKRSVCRSCAEGDVCNAMNECQALSVLRHEKVVRFYNSWLESGSVMVQMEYCVGGSLFDCLHEITPMHTTPSTPLSPNISHVDGDSVGAGGAAYRVLCGGTRQTALRGLSDAALTKLLGDVASALDYMHTKWCMAHRSVGLRTILVQLRPRAAHRAFGSKEAMKEARVRCHELLVLGGGDEVDFKLASFGMASRVNETEDARGDDVYALGVTVCLAASGAGLPLADNEVKEVDASNVPASLQFIVQLMLRPLAVDQVTASDVVQYLVVTHNGRRVDRRRRYYCCVTM